MCEVKEQDPPILALYFEKSILALLDESFSL
jgi:hypothetical protein